MSTIDRAGDRSRWISQERYDIQDITNDAALNEALIMRQGGIMGKCAGIVGTPPTFTWNAVTQRLAVGACILAYSTDDGNGYENQFATVRYDPAQAWQTQQAPNLGAYSVAGIPCTLWAQRTAGAADSETRRVWSAGAETAQTVDVVYREKVIMTATAVTNPAPFPWFPFAKVTWNAGTPIVVPLDLFDGDFQGSTLGNASTMTAFPVTATKNLVGNLVISKGLVPLLKVMRQSLAQILDTTLATPWWLSPPGGGLTQLSTTATGLQTQLNDRGNKAAVIMQTDVVGTPSISYSSVFGGGTLAIFSYVTGTYTFTLNFPGGVSAAAVKGLVIPSFSGGSGFRNVIVNWSYTQTSPNQVVVVLDLYDGSGAPSSPGSLSTLGFVLV